MRLFKIITSFWYDENWIKFFPMFGEMKQKKSWKKKGYWWHIMKKSVPVYRRNKHPEEEPIFNKYHLSIQTGPITTKITIEGKLHGDQ